jgi:hypothetical protein
MILNILLIIILLIVFYRIKPNAESYENPFIYDYNPLIDRNKLTYTPPPYIPATDYPSLSAMNNINGFIEKNNKLIIDYADDSNFIIDDPNVKNVKLLSFIDKQLFNNNKCLTNYNNGITSSCNSNEANQKWSLINDHIINPITNKCLDIIEGSDKIYLKNYDKNSISQQWIPDTNGRIHSLKFYNKCIEPEASTSLKLNTCSDSTSQIWYN